MFFIAEIGLNHNGEINLAKEMVLSAKESGADAVKFQSIKADKLVSSKTFEETNDGFGLEGVKTSGDFWRKVSIDLEFHHEIKDFCDKNEIEFMSTPFDLAAVDLLENLQVKRYKIASGDITFYPLLQKVASCNKQIILSTGGSFIGEIEEAVNLIKKNGTDDIVLLHCVSLYPTLPEIANLYSIELLKKVFNLKVGFSDHTLGIHIPLAAIALGATYIEKHITIDKTLPGPDQKVSADPKEFKALVKQGKEIYSAVKNKSKEISDEEFKMRKLMRRGIVAARDLPKGTVLLLDDIDFKRPADGVSPVKLSEILGKVLVYTIEKDSPILLNYIH